MNHLIDQLLTPHADRDSVFLILPDDTTVDYRRFTQRVNQVAGLLASLGVEPGERVAAQTPKVWTALALYLGTIKAGGVFVPLNTDYTLDEARYFVENAEPQVAVCQPDDAEGFTALLKSLGSSRVDRRVLTLNSAGEGSLPDAADKCPTCYESVPRSPQDVAAILYTSGTTGRSKGAMLTHDNLWSNAKVLKDCWQFTQQDVLLHALPIFHTHGLFVATNVLVLSGGSMIFMPRFRVDEAIRQLPKSTSMMGVPTFYTRLLADSRFDQDLVRHMRIFVSGSAPLLAETHRTFRQRTGHQIVERYGLTETGMNTSNPYQGECRAGMVGLALPGIEVRIAAVDSGEILSPDNIGSIQVRGPNVFSGYWRMPEKTSEDFTKDGFFVTGDLGRLSEDLYLTIVGRNKDLIISGGYNVYPKEVELLLDCLPGVDESAVIGVPHPDFGEGVIAVLTGTAPPDEETVIAAMSEHLARFKQLKRIFYRSELPRNSMGKVQKNRLRKWYKDAFLTEIAE